MDGPRRVMCVEDDADIRMILDFSLQRLGGFELCLCGSGREALDRVAILPRTWSCSM